MIFISAETPDSIVFFAAFKPTPPFGDLMKKSATLITTALLTFGFAAASMAADAPAGTPAAAGASAPAAKTHKHTSGKKHSKKTSTAAAASK